MALLLNAFVQASGQESFAAGQETAIVNADFESGNLKGWNKESWRTKAARISRTASDGSFALELGPERGTVSQRVPIQPDSMYRLSAMLRTEVGAEEVQLIVSEYGGVKLSVSSALTEYTRVSLEFRSARAANHVMITTLHPSGSGKGYVDEMSLTRLGEAPPLQIQEMIKPPPRKILSEGGITQQPDEVMNWFLDAKFGMFIHWGVYAAMDEGSEWVMHNKAYSPETYRERAEDPQNGFTASNFNPSEWAELAKAAGMKYMALTARHHDGYALFDSRHENSWTSVKHLGRDLIREYVDAVRNSGLHVGLYYSPMSWRYPGYYNVTGTNMLPNVWRYEAEPWHKENARIMKEEVYEQVARLLSDYGPIEYMFWDGAWIGQTINPDLEDRFWDTGRYQDPDGDWQIADQYKIRVEDTGKALGIMGIARKFQPKLIVNERFSWIGDVFPEEGISLPAGPIRNEKVMEKCMTLMKGGWGYRPNRPVFSFDEVAVYLSGCATRNINLLLNVSPDRTGRIPENQRAVLLQIGEWMGRVGDAFYETRGGPWQPLFGEYGFTFKGNRIFCHVFAGYQNIGFSTFTTQSLGGRKIDRIRDLYSGKEMEWTENENGTISITDVAYSQNPPVTIFEILLKKTL